MVFFDYGCVIGQQSRTAAAHKGNMNRTSVPLEICSPDLDESTEKPSTNSNCISLRNMLQSPKLSFLFPTLDQGLSEQSSWVTLKILGFFFLPSTTTLHLIRPETIQTDILEMFKSQSPRMVWAGRHLKDPLFPPHLDTFHQALLHSYTWQLIRMDVLSIHEKAK